MVKEIDAYKNFGIFSGKGSIERFEKACSDIGLDPECLLEFFIDAMGDSFLLYEDLWGKEVFWARAFYEAVKESLGKGE